MDWLLMGECPVARRERLDMLNCTSTCLSTSISRVSLYHFSIHIIPSPINFLIHLLRGSPHGDVVNSHLLARDGGRRRRGHSRDGVRVSASHSDVEDDVKAVVECLRPLVAAQLSLGEGVLQFAVQPELQLLGLDRTVEDDFVDVEVSGTSAT